MSNGVKISQAGSDLKNTPDYQLVLSSEKLMMEIALDKDVDEPYESGKVIKIPHELDYEKGHFPAFEFFGDYSVSTYDVPIFYSTIVDENNVYLSIQAYGGPVPSRLRGKLLVYDVDICQRYIDTTSNTLPQPTRKSKIGLKIAADGVPIDSDSKNDSTLISSTDHKNMVVHMIDSSIAEIGGIQFSFTHNLGYRPTHMLYRFQTDGLFFGDNFSNKTGVTTPDAPLRSYALNRDLGFSGIQGPVAGNFAVIILKDPIITP
jgi:hypothetical protein